MNDMKRFICTDCGGTGELLPKFADDPQDCSECSGSGYSSKSILAFISEKGLANIVAGNRLREAMKAGDYDLTVNFSDSKEDRALIWCKDEERWEIINERIVKLSGMFPDSDLNAALDSLLKD
jgi:hypothetical protein